MSTLTYFAEFRDFQGDEYLIELHDALYNGEPIGEFTLDGDGFSLSYSAENELIYSGIIFSRLNLFFLIDTPAFEIYMLNVLSGDTQRYFVRVYKESEPYYFGWVAPELCQAGEAMPYRMVLTITDGIKKWSDIKLGVGFPIEDIFSIFRQLRLPRNFISNTDGLWLTMLYGINRVVLRTATHIKDARHVKNTDYLRFSAPARLVYDNIFEAISDFCLKFGGRFYYEKGCYWFTTVEAMRVQSLTWKSYRYEGSPDADLFQTSDYTESIVQLVENNSISAGLVRMFSPAQRLTRNKFKEGDDEIIFSRDLQTPYFGINELPDPQTLSALLAPFGTQDIFHWRISSSIFALGGTPVTSFWKRDNSVQLINPQWQNSEISTWTGVGDVTSSLVALFSGEPVLQVRRTPGGASGVGYTKSFSVINGAQYTVSLKIQAQLGFFDCDFKVGTSSNGSQIASQLVVAIDGSSRFFRLNFTATASTIWLTFLTSGSDDVNQNVYFTDFVFELGAVKSLEQFLVDSVADYRRLPKLYMDSGLFFDALFGKVYNIDNRHFLVTDKTFNPNKIESKVQLTELCSALYCTWIEIQTDNEALNNSTKNNQLRTTAIGVSISDSAKSLQKLQNAIGFIEWSITRQRTTYGATVGLSAGFSGNINDTTNYAIQIANNTTINIRENGANVHTIAGAVSDDNLYRIEWNQTQIVYMVNRVIVYRSNVLPSFPLQVGAALLSAQVEKLYFGGLWFE